MKSVCPYAFCIQTHGDDISSNYRYHNSVSLFSTILPSPTLHLEVCFQCCFFLQNQGDIKLSGQFPSHYCRLVQINFTNEQMKTTETAVYMNYNSEACIYLLHCSCFITEVTICLYTSSTPSHLLNKLSIMEQLFTPLLLGTAHTSVTFIKNEC